ncbi:MAG: hypothetical protein OCC49_07100 [Fibrobacterales bacterium]
MNKKIPYYRIESYLANEMTPAEEETFENEMDQNPEIRDEFQKQRSITCNKSFNDLFEGVAIQSKNSVLDQVLGLLLKPQLQMAALFSIVCVAVLIMYNPQSTQSTVSEQSLFQAKGSSEIRISVGGELLDSRSPAAVSARDTLTISYRSNSPLYMQLWYRDDAGALTPYLTNEGVSLMLKPVTSFSAVESSIVLDDTWLREELYLLTSVESFTMPMNDREIALPIHGSISVQMYTLMRE